MQQPWISAVINIYSPERDGLHPAELCTINTMMNNMGVNIQTLVKIHRIYGRITGNQLPVYVPLFYGIP